MASRVFAFGAKRPKKRRQMQPLLTGFTRFEMIFMSNEFQASDFTYDPLPLRQTLRLWKTTLANERVMADSTGMELDGKNALIRALVLRRLLRKYVLAESETQVGILLPPSVPAALTNVALTMDRKIAVNLNYTLNSDMLNVCLRKARIRHLITSRKVMEKFDFRPECELVYLEDLAKKIGLGIKLGAAYEAKILSLTALLKKLRLDQVSPDDTMAILFTSGSTGQPKGVMLTHRNLAANTESCRRFFHLTSDDVISGILPFFHSMGYMATLWASFAIGMRVFYHYTPLEYRVVGKLCAKYRPTILLGTPTFLRLYVRKFAPDDLASVNLVMCGAERCPTALLEEYERRFAVRPVQGYGITETSPVIAANLSRKRGRAGIDPEPKDEALGLPLPGWRVKILDIQTEQPCAAGEIGMIWVAGDSVMKGYFDEPQKTAEVIRDGWYKTGDLCRFDADGYLVMAGRLNRFAKIGGEMVPHEGVEDKLNALLGNNLEEPPTLCVTSVPDDRKGEKIVVLYTSLSMTPDEITAKLMEQKYPMLWIPSKEAYYAVDAIPVLGIGKLDLYAVREIAERLHNAK